MSVSGFTPPKADLTSPSTETSSGSVLTKEPAATRVKLDEHAAAAVSGPQRSTAGLVVGCRRMSLSGVDLSATGRGVSGAQAYSASGAPSDDDFANKDDASDLEAVGSDSSGSWHPRPRSQTLQGPTFDDFQKMQKNSGCGSVVPGYHPIAPDVPLSAGCLPRVSSRASPVLDTAGRQGADGEMKGD